MKDMIQADLNDLGGALKYWFSEWPFTGFLTLTWPCGGRWRFNREKYQGDVEWLLRRFETQFTERAGGLGIAVLSGLGILHVHLLLLKESALALTEGELAWFRRRFHHVADARPIYDRETLCGYISSAHHLRDPKQVNIVISGDEVLKQYLFNQRRVARLSSGRDAGCSEGQNHRRSA